MRIATPMHGYAAIASARPYFAKGPGEVDRPGPWSARPPLKLGFNERDAAKVPGPKGHVAASRLDAADGKPTREHRTRGRTQQSERLHFPASRAPLNWKRTHLKPSGLREPDRWVLETYILVDL
jgi:hypothetical protein